MGINKVRQGERVGSDYWYPFRCDGGLSHNTSLRGALLQKSNSSVEGNPGSAKVICPRASGAMASIAAISSLMEATLPCRLKISAPSKDVRAQAMKAFATSSAYWNSPRSP